MPTCTRTHEGQHVFQRTQGNILLKENPLVDQVINSGYAIRAAPYQANQEVFPFKKCMPKCKALLPFEGGRPQNSFCVRPMLISFQLTVQTIKEFMHLGSFRGDGYRLAAKMNIPLGHSVIPVPLVDDSPYQIRIEHF